MAVRAHRYFAIFAGVAALVLMRDLAVTPYDDAYFFARFARNFLAHGVFAWNTADGPVQGLTSQLFQVIATLLLWCAPRHFVVAAKLFLAACLGLTAWLLGRSCARLAQSAFAGGVLALLALCTPPVLATMHSCMETALALLLVTWSLAWAGGEARPVDAALRTLLVYLCRPDAALIPALAFVVAHARDRPRLVRYGAALLAMLGLCLLAFRAYYGTALPLPFYLKTAALSPYGGAIGGLATRSKLEHLATFAAFAAPLVWIVARRAPAPALALCLSALAFVGYHALTNSEIMGYRARFYLPALVPLALAAALAWQGFLAQHSRRSVLLAALGWVVLFAAGHAFGIVDPAREAPASGAWPPRASLLSDRAFLARSSAEVTTTRGLSDVARCLPHVAQVYHSEVGVVGLMLPNARIVDLAGLMSNRIALEHPRFDDYCLADAPELIFLPHKNYVALNHEIMQSACIRDYTQAVKRSSSPLYVRSDLAPRFLACARDSARFRY